MKEHYANPVCECLTVTSIFYTKGNQCVCFLFILHVFLCVKQDCYPDHCGSASGMTVIEGDTNISSTDEENSYKANKKTDEITGLFCDL